MTMASGEAQKRWNEVNGRFEPVDEPEQDTAVDYRRVEDVHRAQVNTKLLEMRRELSELATKVDRLDPVSEQLDAIRARLALIEEWCEVDDLAVRVKALEDVQGSDEYVPVDALRTDLESLQTAVQEHTKALSLAVPASARKVDDLIDAVRGLVTTLRDQTQSSALEVWEQVKADARDQVRAPIMQSVLPGADLGRLGAGSIIVEHLSRPREGIPLYRDSSRWRTVRSGRPVVPDHDTAYRVLYDSKGAL